MTLTTHAIVGAAAASLFPHSPTLAFVVAFASHFAIDAIPHWDYDILSAKKDEKNPLNNDMVIGKEFFLDLMRIGFDAYLGIVVALLLFGGSEYASLLNAFIGAVAGILPDPLQFVYWKFRHEPFVSLQRFHVWIHAKTTIEQAYVGAPIQAMIVVLVYWVGL
jgi:hypothetical protein